MHADLGARQADIAVPPEGGGLLDRDAGGDVRRQDLVAVGLVLLLEELPRRHRDHARADALGLQRLVGADAELHLAAGRHQDDLRLAALAVGEDVGTAGDAGGGRVLGAVDRRQCLARQHDAGRLVAHRQHRPPGLGHLVGVGGAEHEQARDRAQADQLLDRLVGGPILADADRIVGEDVDDRQLHQRREADRRLHVVGEDQEAGARTSAASTATCRCRSPPWRARGCRSGSCGRHRSRPRSRRRRRR